MLNYYSDMKTSFQSTAPKFATTFFIVVAIHLAIAGLFIGNVAYGKQAENDSVYVGVEQPIPDQQNYQTAEPSTQSKADQKIKQTIPANQPTTNSAGTQYNSSNKTTNNNVTKSYTVKAGDTIFSISKKYKLNVANLLKINNIKDPNKISVGQTLKFVK